VLPIAIVAVVSYGHVRRELRSQTERRLEQANKALGLAVYERLLLLDATLRSIPPSVMVQLQGAPPAEASRLLNTGLDLLASRRFVALEFIGDDGGRLPVFGRLTERPSLTPGNQKDLRLGLPLIVNLRDDGQPARTFMLRRVERLGEVRGALVGQVSARFLWGSLASSMPSPTTVVTVADDSGNVLFRSTQTELLSQADPITEAAPEVHPVPAAVQAPPSRPFVSSTWPILLDEVFAAPTWTLTLSESEDEVLGPVVHFSQTFIWVVLLSGVGVLVLSVTQIRRSLVPLAELREGTSRIAQRDFGSRVRVTSRDEFEELAIAFNGMAVQLGRQFQALSTAAELDRAVLSATDVASIVDTLLARTRDVFPCHLVGVTLVAPDGGKSLSGVVYDYCDDARHSARVDLRSEDVQDLLDGPDLVAVEVPNGPHPAYLGPILQLGARSVLVLPLRFQRQLVGILAIGERGAAGAGADERLQLRRLADQVAVALANAQMLEQVKSLAYYDSLTGRGRSSTRGRPASWWRRSSSTSTTSAASTTPSATRWATSCSSRSRSGSARPAATARTRWGRRRTPWRRTWPGSAATSSRSSSRDSPTRRTRPSSRAAS
jgi:HAMP domain-containing protein